MPGPHPPGAHTAHAFPARLTSPPTQTSLPSWSPQDPREPLTAAITKWGGEGGGSLQEREKHRVVGQQQAGDSPLARPSICPDHHHPGSQKGVCASRVRLFKALPHFTCGEPKARGGHRVYLGSHSSTVRNGVQKSQDDTHRLCRKWLLVGRSPGTALAVS